MVEHRAQVRINGRIGTEGARSFVAPIHLTLMKNIETISPGFKIYEDLTCLKKPAPESRNVFQFPDIQKVSEVSYINLQLHTPPPPIPPRKRVVSKVNKPPVPRRCIFTPAAHSTQSSVPVDVQDTLSSILRDVQGTRRRTGEAANIASSWGNRVLRV